MKKNIFLFFLLLIISLPSFGVTRQNSKIGHIFGAYGLLHNLSSVRIGMKSWEVGLLNTGTLGINKIANISPNTYTSLGIALLGSGLPGIYAAIGYEFVEILYFTLRFEANGTVNYKNQSSGGLLFGVSGNF